VSLAPHVLVPSPLADGTDGTIVALPAATLHHLRRALRLGVGSLLSLTDGLGGRAPAELVADGARLTGAPALEPASSPRIVLVQALAKGRRVDEAVRMACELGVDRVVPLVADRTQGRPDARTASAVVDRWQAVARAALEQSRGVHLAEVTGCHTVAQLAAAPSGPGNGGDPGGVRLVAVPGAPALPEVLAAPGPTPELSVAVGPEGGWSDAEVAQLVGSGWQPVGLGPSVLRTEHAGPVAVAVIAALAGRWRVGPRVRGAPGGYPQ